MAKDSERLVGAFSWCVEKVALRGVRGTQPELNAAGAEHSKANGISEGELNPPKGGSSIGVRGIPRGK